MIRILKRLFRLMSQYKGRLYLGIALSMISNILGIVPIICGVWTINLRPCGREKRVSLLGSKPYR